MRQKHGTRRTASENTIKDIRRATRKQYSAEEKIRIVLDGLRGEETIADSKIVDVVGQGNISGGTPDTEYMIMKFASGAMGHLLYNSASYSTVLPNEGMYSGGQGYREDSSIFEPGRWEDHPGSISVYGTTGSLRIFYYTNALYLNTGDGPNQVALSGRAPFGHFATQLEECIASIANDLPPAISGEVGKTTLENMLWVYR